MSDFRGMSYDRIEGIYYRLKRQDSDFIPIDFEEVERSKRKATATKDHVTKKAKVTQEKESQSEKLSEDQQSAIIVIKEEDFYPDPIQTRHPIIDWEVFTAKNLLLHGRLQDLEEKLHHSFSLKISLKLVTEMILIHFGS